MTSPDPRQDRRSYAEGDDVCQRIEFPPEVAGGIRHAGNAAIESIEDHGESNRLRSIVKMKRSAG